MTAVVFSFGSTSIPPGAERSASEVIPWLILFIGIVLVGGVLIFYVRKWMKGGGFDSSGSAGFTLQELRDMHARGELTDAEFHSARAAMIGRLSGCDQRSAISGQPLAGDESTDSKHPPRHDD